MSSISFLWSSSSFCFFFAAFDVAVDLDAFETAFLVRLKVDEGVEDFFRGLVVSFEVFFVAMRRTLTQLRVDFQMYLYSVSTIVATRCRNAAAGSVQRPVWTGEV